MEPVTSSSPSVRLTLSGADRPGLLAAVFNALTDHAVAVVDMEQVVVGGHLTLGILLRAAVPSETADRASPFAAVITDVQRVCARLGLQAQSSIHVDDEPIRVAGPTRLIVTVLAQPLHPVAVTAVADRLAAAGANIDRVARLGTDPVTAVEFIVSGAEIGVVRSLLAGSAGLPDVTIAVRPRGLDERGRRLVVLDVDSTLIEQEVINLLAECAGVQADVARITEDAMAGRLDFATSLHHRVSLLAGLPEAVLAEVTAAVRWTPGARTLIRTLQRLDDRVALVSGGFHDVVDPLARDLGVVDVRANRLEITDGRLTGRVIGPVIDRRGKADALRSLAALHAIPLIRTVAVGDGANDLDMLEAAGLGIAFNAAPTVAARADAAIHLRRLDSVLFLLGIGSDEVADAGYREPRQTVTSHT